MEVSIIPDGVECSSLEDEVAWWAVPPLITQDDNGISNPDLFNVFRRNDGLRYRFYLFSFKYFVRLSI